MIVPSREAFIEETYNIFPKGNPETAFNEMVYQVQFIKKDFLGNEITYEIITKKFQQYINLCKTEVREEKYIKGLESWLKSKDYNIDYDKKLKPRKSLSNRTVFRK